MTYIQSLILGIFQGFAEFLPVSSSGHLAFMERLMSLQDTPLFYDIILHLASLSAIFLFFRKKIFSLFKSLYTSSMKRERKYILFILISTAITGVFYPLTKPLVVLIKSNPNLLFFTFIITSILLFFTDSLMKKKSGRKDITLKDSIICGFFQVFAVLPGISRSGSTICASMLSGKDSESSVEYSFILAIPAILGASLLEFLKIESFAIPVPVILTGFISSFIISLIALKILTVMIRKTILKPFAFYLLVPAFAALVLF